MGDWKLGALEAVFGMGKPARIADVSAWIVDGDEAAFGRLSGRASMKLKDWYSLGLIGADPDDATLVERGLRLVRTVRSGEELIGWIVASNERWVLAYHRDWQAEHGGPEVVPATHGYPHDRRLAALAALLSAIRSDEVLFRAAFEPLCKGSWPATTWGLLATLGAEHREDGAGRHRRAVRRLGPIVAVQEKGKTRVHVLDGDAAADAFVAALPPVGAAVERETLLEAEGLVSLWVDAELDPRGTLDGKGGPVGWFDHDDWEIVRGGPDQIRKLSYAASFADAAIGRAHELGVSWPAKIDALYGRRLTGTPGKRKYGWYLGAFPYQAGRPS